MIKYFVNKPVITKRELIEYFDQHEIGFNHNTINWRIFDLKKKNLLKKITRDLYTLTTTNTYTPPYSQTLSQITTLIAANYEEVLYCVWEIDALNEFSVHQINSNAVMFEIEKDQIETATSIFSEAGYTVIPAKLFEKINTSGLKDPVILIRPLITRSPVQQIPAENNENTFVPTLEKLLIDTYLMTKYHTFVQGAEVIRIFEHATERFAINFTTFDAYAKRRGKLHELHSFMTSHLPEHIKNAINDKTSLL